MLFWNKSSEKSSRDDRSVCAGAYEGLGSLWVIAVATYIQRKYKQKQITHDRSSVIWQKIIKNVNASKVVDRIDLTKFKNARTWLTVNAALRPDYVRNTESPMFLRKISLQIACRLAIKIETASWRISYRQRSSVSKTRIAWARDRFYILQSFTSSNIS